MFSWLPAQWLFQCSSHLHGMSTLMMVVVRFSFVALLDVRSMVFLCLLCAFYYTWFACHPERYGFYLWGWDCFTVLLVAGLLGFCLF